MAKWASIIGDLVHETTDIDPNGRFPDDMNWLPCTSSVREGWIYSEGVFSAQSSSLEEVRAARISSLTNSCGVAIVSGYVSSALGSAHTYPSGVTDQINMMGSVTASLLPDLGSDWSTPFWCEDANGVWAFRVHSPKQIQTAGSDGKGHIVKCQAVLETLSASVSSSQSVEMVALVQWPTPEEFDALGK
jgi:hypothetical protein